METEYIYEADLGSFAPGTGEGEGNQEDGNTVEESVTEEVAGEMDEQEVDVDAEIAGIEESIRIDNENDGNVAGEEMIGIDTGDGAIISGDQIPMMTAPAHVTQPDVEISQEDELKSTERLDRSSPDLWPQNLPSAAQHILAKTSSKSETDQSLGIWAQGLDPEDINLLHQFGSLTSSSLIEEVKKLQNIAYQLGLEESKEMTRGKLLHVLDENDMTEAAREKRNQVQRLWK